MPRQSRRPLHRNGNLLFYGLTPFRRSGRAALHIFKFGESFGALQRLDVPDRPDALVVLARSPLLMTKQDVFDFTQGETPEEIASLADAHPV
ncbi:hypothetical protein SAMN05428967_4473 [Phyllobacterium sp. YR620]|nr:hypothetical protein SAMN05428967_4473 [Phyllobacterium sp. YR620]